jgi:hypothetical protein
MKIMVLMRSCFPVCLPVESNGYTVKQFMTFEHVLWQEDIDQRITLNIMSSHC